MAGNAQINDLINKLATIGNQGADMSASAESLSGTATRIDTLLGQIEAVLTDLVGLCREHATRGGEIAGLLAQLQAADATQEALIRAITGHNGSATTAMFEAGAKVDGIKGQSTMRDEHWEAQGSHREAAHRAAVAADEDIERDVVDSCMVRRSVCRAAVARVA